MKDELDKKLCEDFPKIFKDRHASMQVTAMCWGLSVGDGWYSIIRNACRMVQHHINNSRYQRARALKYNRALRRALDGDLNGLKHYHTYNGTLSDWGLKRVQDDVKSANYMVVREACPQLVAIQVKEKFGTLRFYYRGGDEYCSGVISMAEAMTSSTCEECGDVGKSMSDGWVRVLCNTHGEEWLAHRKKEFGDDE